MLWSKGVGKFVGAIEILKRKGISVRAQLAGISDSDDPASIPHEQLVKWNDEGIIEWVGYISNISVMWLNCNPPPINNRSFR